MTPLDATAIVITHNSEKCIGGSLAALCRAGLTVRVVDNASIDRTVALVTKDFPGVEMIANQVNVGFAAAVNQALHGVDSDITLLVNPDCVLPETTARELVSVLRLRPEVGIVGPRLIGADGRVAISAHPFESLASVVASRFGGHLAPVALRRMLCGNRRRRTYDACRGSGTAVSVDWLSGACLAVRTCLMTDIGGLNEKYFLYYEDEELCLQARRRGKEVLYVPTVEAIHSGGGSSSEDPTSTWPHLYRSMLLFFARHRRSTFQPVRAVVLLRALIGIGLAGARLPVRPQTAAARARAWTEVTRIALTATRNRLEAP
jgi:N-acetylglucosaminyl-diphospho-decaprenol L-rhamnosyltransferase